jgi:CRISPR-associated endonuclease/helicase Cas3
MAESALELEKDGGRRVIVFVNSCKTAQAIAERIEKDAPKAPKPELLVGARRVHERERLKSSDVFKRFSPEAGPGGGPVFLVATSAGEVGVDLDADALVCDLAPWERMVQRLGRVNRRAEPGEAPVVAFDAIEDDNEGETSADGRAKPPRAFATPSPLRCGNSSRATSGRRAKTARARRARWRCDASWRLHGTTPIWAPCSNARRRRNHCAQH